MKPNKKVLIIFAILTVMVSAVIILFHGKSETGAKQVSMQKPVKYFCPMHPNVTSDRPGDCPICNMRLVPADPVETPAASKEKASKKVLFYRHPMRPDVSSPVPAKDEMGMDYIPVYEEEPIAEDPKSVCMMHQCSMLKDGQPCSMIVVAREGEMVECPDCKQKMEIHKKDQMELAQQGYTSILISPEKQQLIGIRTSLVERKSLIKTIRTVGKVAYDPMLYQAEAEFIQATKALNDLKAQGPSADTTWAQKLVDSSRTKLIGMGLNDQMMQAIEQSQAPDKSLLYAIPGGDAWVYAAIYEYEISLVKVGDVLKIEAPTAPEENLEAQIISVDTVVDPMTRSVRVRALIKNEKGLLKPDMFVNAALRVDLGEVIVIPEEAVVAPGTSNIVFVDKGNGLFDPRHVVLGQRTEGLTEVKSGLREGEVVITNGNFLVDSESRLKAALAGIGGHSGHS